MKKKQMVRLLCGLLCILLFLGGCGKAEVENGSQGTSELGSTEIGTDSESQTESQTETETETQGASQTETTTEETQGTETAAKNPEQSKEPSKPQEPSKEPAKPQEPSQPQESKPQEPEKPQESKPQEPSKPQESKPQEPSQEPAKPQEPEKPQEEQKPETPKPETPVQSPEYNLAMAKESLALQNEERARNGVAALAWDEELYNCILVRGPEIAESFDHTRPNGESCFSVVTVDWSTVGENIAEGYRSAADVTNGWIESRGHHANMINPDFTSAAVVCYYVPNSDFKYYWVTMFRG